METIQLTKHKIYRNENSSDENNVRKNKSSGWKLVQIGIFSTCHLDTDLLGIPQSHVHLLHLLYHGCGCWGFRFTIHDVVGSKLTSFSFEKIIDLAIWKNSKVPIRLAHSGWIFHCCSHTLHSNIVHISVFHNCIIHFTWMFLQWKCNVNWLGHQHQFTQWWSKIRCTSKTNDWTNLRYHWNACICAWVECNVLCFHLLYIQFELNSNSF